MTRKLRIHDGKRTAEDYRRLQAALDETMSSEADRLAAADEPRDLDRAKIAAAFRSAGFDPVLDWQLDLEAPLCELLPDLQFIHEDLPIYIELYERYPSGELDSGDLVPIDEIIRDWDPED